MPATVQGEVADQGSITHLECTAEVHGDNGFRHVIHALALLKEGLPFPSPDAFDWLGARSRSDVRITRF